MRDVAREPHLVRRDHHRHPLGGELADRVQDLGDQHRVERARDLVQEQDVRVHRQRPDDRDSLLLTAREPVGVVVGLVRKTEALQQLSVALASASARGRPSTFPEPG